MRGRSNKNIATYTFMSPDNVTFSWELHQPDVIAPEYRNESVHSIITINRIIRQAVGNGVQRLPRACHYAIGDIKYRLPCACTSQLTRREKMIRSNLVPTLRKAHTCTSFPSSKEVQRHSLQLRSCVFNLFISNHCTVFYRFLYAKLN